MIALFALAALAADHAEAPGTAPDPVADIGDLFAWHHDDVLTVVLTFGGYTAVGNYDRDVLYSVLIDNDGDQQADHRLDIRYGDKGEDWAVQVQGLPGTTEPVVSELDSTMTGPWGKLFAGVVDDPFFFDLDGFETTLATGDLAFDSTRDFVAGGNANALVFELPLATLRGEGDALDVWAVTARRGGAQ